MRSLNPTYYCRPCQACPSVSVKKEQIRTGVLNISIVPKRLGTNLRTNPKHVVIFFVIQNFQKADPKFPKYWGDASAFQNSKASWGKPMKQRFGISAFQSFSECRNGKKLCRTHFGISQNLSPNSLPLSLSLSLSPSLCLSLSLSLSLSCTHGSMCMKTRLILKAAFELLRPVCNLFGIEFWRTVA